MRRGDIYWVRIPYHTGHEQAKDRPCVIVSCDALNNTSETVVVIFLTRRGKRWTPGHVNINSADRPSVALCEQICTIDKRRLERCIGHVTDREMAEIDAALHRTMSLPEASKTSDAQALWTELQVYKQMYDELLNRVACR